MNPVRKRYFDDGREPETVYDSHANFVPALPPQASPLAGALGQLMQTAPSTAERDALAIQHMQAMSEKSTPVDRNVARLIHYAGWAMIAGAVAIALYAAGVKSPVAWCIFVVVLVVGVVKANHDENTHSPAGVERHKTDGYVTVRLAEIDAGDRANERNHETFEKVLDKVYHAPNRDL